MICAGTKMSFFCKELMAFAGLFLEAGGTGGTDSSTGVFLRILQTF